MKASELIGKIAIRIRPSLSGDRTYMSSPLVIEEVTATHIVAYTRIDKLIGKDYFLLNGDWVDLFWIEAPELIALQFQNKLDRETKTKSICDDKKTDPA
ncbi:MAG: hypothetical protein KAR42_16200 [candidate division Zixibacteria bacterium]|nr:hypothetical protein [candidate division Zixibacteria bacterium]